MILKKETKWDNIANLVPLFSTRDQQYKGGLISDSFYILQKNVPNHYYELFKEKEFRIVIWEYFCNRMDIEQLSEIKPPLPVLDILDIMKVRL